MKDNYIKPNIREKIINDKPLSDYSIRTVDVIDESSSSLDSQGQINEMIGMEDEKGYNVFGINTIN